MSDSDGDYDYNNYWGKSKTRQKSSPNVTSSPTAKKADIKLSFSIPSLSTSPAQDDPSEATLKPFENIHAAKPPIIPTTQHPILTVESTTSDESSLYQDEDKSDLHEILDALLNFESIIEAPTDEMSEKSYSRSQSLASLDTYGKSARRQEVQRENSRLAKQIKQSKSCISKGSSPKTSAAISAATQSINRTKLSRLEQENLNLLKRIQSAKTTKAVSRKEHQKHFESHKVYGKISSKQRQPNLSATTITTRVPSSLSQPEWNF